MAVNNVSYCRGSSLIEVLITLLIFTVGLLGFAGLQLNALQSTGDSSQRSQAVWITQELAERMRANAAATINDYTSAATNCSNLPTQICADHYNPVGGAKVNATQCIPAQMAAFDVWEAQCSYSGTATYQANSTAANGRYSSRDFLSTPASGTQPLALNASGTRLIMTSNWSSKGAKTTAGESLSSSLDVQR
ncbi:MAG: type IV pilus modification protein PilV [Pseudomonas sp. PGPPP3]|nr:MAG: type IV pilus modification protein PilV [Pseudomonas sp. PGPPP3]